MHSRQRLHPYQLDAIGFLLVATDRQLIAVMGSGKTAVALHAIADLTFEVAPKVLRPVLVVAPLLIAETVWKAEAATCGSHRRAWRSRRDCWARQSNDRRRSTARPTSM